MIKTYADPLGIPKFSVAERDARWRKVRSLMARDDIDVIFVPPNTGMFDTFQANVRYLTGLGGNHSMVSAIFPLVGEVTAIASPDVDKEIWLQRQDWITDIRGITGGWGFTGSAVARLRELGKIRRLGVTGLSGNTRFPEGITSFGVIKALGEMLPDVEIVNANALMEEARFVKSAEEIEFLRNGLVLAERAVDLIASEAQPGVPENIVYARLIASILEGGGEIPTMILWSIGTPQPPSNFYLPTRRPIQRGDVILTELDARWGGYCPQVTQPFWVGKAPAEYHAMFAVQQEAVAKCYELLRPGVTLREIADQVNDMSDDHYDVRILMHGRGLGDDSPLAVYGVRSEAMGDWVMEENCSFVVKPTVWNKDHSLKIYWGDTVVCTPDGARRLGTRKPALIEIE